jgi:hypothetical protein
LAVPTRKLSAVSDFCAKLMRQLLDYECLGQQQLPHCSLSYRKATHLPQQNHEKKDYTLFQRW